MVSTNAKTDINILTVTDLMQILSQMGLSVGVPVSDASPPIQASTSAVDVSAGKCTHSQLKYI